ncbi:MAG: type II toxin-antitoxin system VapC family toxin [Acidobacteriales bacterium]|nr:type II toxin-antitoxin system VapC family toxin [Terriglobales bacterium]
MLLIDVNVLVRAHRPDAERHGDCRNWLEQTLQTEEAVGFSELVLSAVIRIVTHRGIFAANPTPLRTAIEYVEQLREHPSAVLLSPGARHWQIFTQLCRVVEARGNLITDAYFAALAIESGADWITTDRDYARFPGLRWRHPLTSA